MSGPLGTPLLGSTILGSGGTYIPVDVVLDLSNPNPKFPIMVGGFANAFRDPQLGFASPMQQYPDHSNSSVVKTPDEPTWCYTYDVEESEEDPLYDNGSGVAFSDEYNGIFDVDTVVDEESEYDAVIDAGETS